MNKSIEAPSKFYIYGLVDPRTKEVRYIGRTRSLKYRYRSHISRSNRKKTHRDCWICSLSNLDLLPEMVVLFESIGSWEESYEVEKSFISNYRLMGYDLTNHDDLGAGGKNKIISKEQREKISKKVKALHEQGKLSCNRKKVDVYDLNANFISTFESHVSAAKYIGVSVKHLENSIKRRDKRLRNFIVLNHGEYKPSPWKYKKRAIPTKKYLSIKGDESVTHNSKKEMNIFFNLPCCSSKLNYYIDQDRTYTGWMLIRMPD